MAEQQKRGDREVPREAESEPGARARTDSDVAMTTMVCITCGNEEFFDQRVPETLKCRRCGGTVFRTFETPEATDEAAAAAAEEAARSIAYGDASPDTAPDEVRDLDAR